MSGTCFSFVFFLVTGVLAFIQLLEMHTCSPFLMFFFSFSNEAEWSCAHLQNLSGIGAGYKQQLN